MNTTTEEKKVNPKREILKRLSRKAKVIRELMEDPEGVTINEILIDEFYTKDGHEEFNLFWQWIKKGYKVKKGEKAFLVWGRKRKAQNNEPKEGDKDEFSFFPLAFVFSNLQVEPLKP